MKIENVLSFLEIVYASIFFSFNTGGKEIILIEFFRKFQLISFYPKQDLIQISKLCLYIIIKFIRRAVVSHNHLLISMQLKWSARILSKHTGAI